MGTSDFSTIATVFYLIVVIGIVLALAYYGTKFVGKNSAGRLKGKNMKVLEILPMGLDKNLILIEVGKKNFLFSNTQKGLVLVSEINSDDLNKENVSEFEELLKKESMELSEPFDSTIKGKLKRLQRMFRGNNSND